MWDHISMMASHGRKNFLKILYQYKEYAHVV